MSPSDRPQAPWRSSSGPPGKPRAGQGPEGGGCGRNGALGLGEGGGPSGVHHPRRGPGACSVRQGAENLANEANGRLARAGAQAAESFDWAASFAPLAPGNEGHRGAGREKDDDSGWEGAVGWAVAGAAGAKTGYDAAVRRSSTLGRVLQTSDDAAARSAAASRLRSAGNLAKFGRTGLYKAGGRALGAAGGAFVAYDSWKESKGKLPEAATRWGIEVGLSSFGGWIGSYAAGALLVAAAPAAPVALVVGAGAAAGIAFGWFGDKAGDLLFDD